MKTYTEILPEAPAAYHIGLDLGLRSEYTGLCVIEQIGREVRRSAAGDMGRYSVRHLKRIRPGTPYPAMIARVSEICAREPLATLRPSLCLDATAVGRSIVDMFTCAGLNCEIIAITITGGYEVIRQSWNNFFVPKRDLVGTVQALLQTGRLKIAPALLEAATLMRELDGFQLRPNELTADAQSLMWRGGAQDDLVFAVALACWHAARPVYEIEWS